MKLHESNPKIELQNGIGARPNVRYVPVLFSVFFHRKVSSRERDRGLNVNIFEAIETTLLQLDIDQVGSQVERHPSVMQRDQTLTLPQAISVVSEMGPAKDLSDPSYFSNAVENWILREVCSSYSARHTLSEVHTAIGCQALAFKAV